MASKSKKAKAPKVAIGDQILTEVAKWQHFHKTTCSLREFASDDMRIKSLINAGYLELTETGKYKLTYFGMDYVRRNFPEKFSAIGQG